MADDSHRLEAVLAASLVAVARTGLQGEAISAALETLGHVGGDQSALRRELESLSAELDEQYFQRTEEADQVTPEAFLMFLKARAAAALSFALSEDNAQLHEAIYEAIVASDNSEEAIQAAKTALQPE